MLISDKESWDACVNANKDFYGSGVVRYAEKWAELMESRIDSGDTVGDCAKATSHDADTEGITGFMYGCAVSILSKVWKYGEELRKWHNLDTQINDEGIKANENGTVLNPAVLSIG